MEENQNPLESLASKIKESAEKMKETLDSFQESLINRVVPALTEQKTTPKRGFEVVTDSLRKFPDLEISLPMRSTMDSAGYDLYSNEDYELKSMERYVFWTDVKVFMQKGEVFKVYVRSSLGFKHGVQVANGTGIIDKDYFSNPSNDGNIGVCLINISKTPVKIAKGDRIAQGIFEVFLEAESGFTTTENERVGGIGSTN